MFGNFLLGKRRIAKLQFDLFSSLFDSSFLNGRGFFYRCDRLSRLGFLDRCGFLHAGDYTRFTFSFCVSFSVGCIDFSLESGLGFGKFSLLNMLIQRPWS